MTYCFARSSRILALVLGLCALDPSQAHEFWLMPSTFSPRPATSVDVSLFVGEFFEGELVAVTSSHAASVRLHSATGAQDLTDKIPRNQIRQLRLSVPSNGTHVLAYDSHPSEVVLSADKFHAYLRDEGLEAIISQRQARGTADKDGRERFRRHAKVLMRAGGKGDATFSVRTGQRLEIVPVSDPVSARAGDRLAWQITFDGKPVAGILLKAWHTDGRQVSLMRGRTDRDGRVSISLPFVGAWMLNTVHMIPGDGVTSDWESHWGSLTFKLDPTAR